MVIFEAALTWTLVFSLWRVHPNLKTKYIYKSGKNIWNEYSAHTQKIGSGQSSQRHEYDKNDIIEWAKAHSKTGFPVNDWNSSKTLRKLQRNWREVREARTLVLDKARALDPCHRPEGSWALETRMYIELKFLGAVNRVVSFNIQNYCFVYRLMIMRQLSCKERPVLHSTRVHIILKINVKIIKHSSSTDPPHGVLFVDAVRTSHV